MDGQGFLGGSWLTPLKCGGLPTLLRFLCLGMTLSSAFPYSMFRLVVEIER